MHLFQTLLRLGLIAGLADREAFVDKLSGLLEKYHSNPGQADKMAGILTAYLENIKDQLSMEEAFNNILSKQDNSSKEDIAEIKKMLEELTRELQALKKDQDHV